MSNSTAYGFLLLLVAVLFILGVCALVALLFIVVRFREPHAATSGSAERRSRR